MAGLQIRLSGAYRSIEKLDASSLPGFAILIGRNGIGKTQPLKALAEGAAIASEIPQDEIEMYDFASFAPGNSAPATSMNGAPARCRLRHAPSSTTG